MWKCPYLSIKLLSELVKGDAVEELEKYLQKNPSTIIALAYFDMDLLPLTPLFHPEN